MKKKVLAIFMATMMSVSIAACGSSSGESTEAETTPEVTEEAEATPETTEDSETDNVVDQASEAIDDLTAAIEEATGITEGTENAVATEHFEVDLSAGNYVAGVDIPAGTYNLTATSGSGNVSSSNMFTGGLNEVMGTPADELTQETFNNLQLPEGETLTLGGTVTLHIVSEDAQTGNMRNRTIGSETQMDLNAGNYTAGTDFPAGVYNIVSTGASGNVSSDNMFEGGLNEVLGDGSDGLSVPQVNNVELPEGTVLSISGTSVQLVPVGE